MGLGTSADRNCFIFYLAGHGWVLDQSPRSSKKTIKCPKLDWYLQHRGLGSCSLYRAATDAACRDMQQHLFHFLLTSNVICLNHKLFSACKRGTVCKS